MFREAKPGRLRAMTKLFNQTELKAKRRALRNHMTEHEIILWSRIQNRQLGGFKFRRQYSVGPYVLDFYCARRKLAIEIDGGGHFEEEQIVYDKKRQAFIEQFGIRFLRFTNLDIRNNLSGVLEAIEEALRE